MTGVERKIIVVGGTLAGLMAALRAVEAGVAVTLVSPAPVRHSMPSLGWEGIFGIDAGAHADAALQSAVAATLSAGCGLAPERSVRAYFAQATAILSFLERIGVPFDRDGEGWIRTYGAPTRGIRQWRAGTDTGRHVHSALAAQALRLRAGGRFDLRQHHDPLALVLDGNGICRGLAVQDLRSMAVETVKGDAVILCQDGAAALFDSRGSRLTHSGAFAARVYRQGAAMVNPEFAETRLALYRGVDGNLVAPFPALAPERLFYSEGDEGRRYLCAESGFAGEAVDERILCRAIFAACNGNSASLVRVDIDALAESGGDKFVLNVWRDLARNAGRNGGTVPVTATVARSLGGLAVDENGATTIPGVFASGESACLPHGADIVPGNHGLFCLASGLIAGQGAAGYVNALARGCHQVDEAHFIRALKNEEENWRAIMDLSGPENAGHLHDDLAVLMRDNLMAARDEAALKSVLMALKDLRERQNKIGVPDKGSWCNFDGVAVRHLEQILESAQLMAYAALMRRESRGTHYRTDCSMMDDARHLQRTIARHGAEGSRISYGEVDESVVPEPVTVAENTPRVRAV